jgi:hypothetical protein
MEYNAMHKDYDGLDSAMGSYGTKSQQDVIPKYFDPEDLARGSYGIHVDKYLGRSPSDGPPGFIFRKVSYNAAAVSNNSKIAAMYKACSDHMGYIYQGPNTAAEVRINNDGADRGGTDTTNVDGSLNASEAKLIPGDYILGAILHLIDGRATDTRTGYISAGFVSNDSSEPDTYGTELRDDPSNFITGSSISGGKTASASSVKALSVASPNLNIYAPYRVATAGQDATADLAPAPVANPINAINISGVGTAQSGSIRFGLTVYALVGARQKTVAGYTSPDPDFKMSCLTRQTAVHPVSIVY